MKNAAAQNKFEKVMHEFGQGELKSHGKQVTDHKQALAIAFSEARNIDPNYAEGGDIGKIAVKKIVLTDSDGKPFIGTSTFKSANEALKKVWENNKHSDAKYKIEWQDGETLSGSIDLEPHDFHSSHKDNILSWHLKTFWGNVSKSDVKPYLSQEEINEAKTLVEKYAFDDEKSAVTSSGQVAIKSVTIEWAEGLKKIYEKGTAAELWQAWDPKQRTHFLIDHASQFNDLMGDDYNKSAQAYITLTYDTLPSEIKKEVAIHHAMGMYSEGGSMETERMYNFLKDDLEKLEKAVSEGDKEEIERFFSYWNHHLKSLKTKTNDRMYNFLKDDLEKLEKAVSEGNKEEVEKFFSYWNQHLKSLKMADGGEADYSFEYQMLSRLQMDNDYYLGHGNRSEKTLWAGNVDDQIAEMKRLWNKLPVKPEWLSMEDILDYERKMKSDTGSDSSIKKEGGNVGRYAGDKVYLGKYRNRFVVVDAKSNELWANEYFKTKEDAIEFINLNEFNLISEEVIEWDKKTETPGGKPIFAGVSKKKKYARGGGVEDPLEKLLGQLDDLRIDLEDEDEQTLSNVTGELEEAKTTEEAQKILSDNKKYLNTISDKNTLKLINESIEQYQDSISITVGDEVIITGGNPKYIGKKGTVIHAYDKQVSVDIPGTIFGSVQRKGKTFHNNALMDRTMVKKSSPSMGEGGGVNLFEDYENIPPKVQRILNKYPNVFEEGDSDYAILEKAHDELKKIGYTFEYGLDGSPYDLRKIGEKGKSEFMKDGGPIQKWEIENSYIKCESQSQQDQIAEKLIQLGFKPDHYQKESFSTNPYIKIGKFIFGNYPTKPVWDGSSAGFITQYNELKPSEMMYNGGSIIGDARAKEIIKHVLSDAKQNRISLPALQKFVSEGPEPGILIEAYEEFEKNVNNGSNSKSLRLNYEDSNRFRNYVMSLLPNSVQRKMHKHYGDKPIQKNFPGYMEGGAAKKVGGRGFFGLEKGERIKSEDEISKGDILLEHSDQFNADNTIKVTEIRKYGTNVHVSGIYWDPIKDQRIGNEEFSIDPDPVFQRQYYRIKSIKMNGPKISPAKKKLQDRINTLKAAKANAGASAQKSIQAKIDVLQRQFDYSPSAKERAQANKGKFALDVPASYSKSIYKKLWAMNVLPSIHKLNDTHSIVVSSQINLDKAYKVYSDMLKENKEKVPALSKISRKL